MEHLIVKPTPPHWLSSVGAVGRFPSLLRAYKRSFGLAPRSESAVLAEMIAALKTASETALQIQIKAVAVTAPWMAVWDNQLPTDSVINDALLLAGLKPWIQRDEAQSYLGEINTVLVSEGRWACPKNFCGGHWMDVEGEEAQGGPVFFIRLVTDTFLHWPVYGLDD
jgi:hypothetical protein